MKTQTASRNRNPIPNGFQEAYVFIKAAATSLERWCLVYRGLSQWVRYYPTSLIATVWAQIMNGHGYPDPLVVPPSGPHTHSCILLHGRGSNAECFGPEFLAAQTSDGQTLQQCFPGCKFIFPTAKKRPAIVLKRMRINQWFDIYSLDDPSQREHLSGWMRLQRQVNDILRSSVSDDGGSILEFQSTEGSEEKSAEQPSGGRSARALSFLRENLSMYASDLANLNCLRTPVFLGHGEADGKVSCALGEDIRLTLDALGMDVEWKLYPEFGHWYKVPDEIDAIRDFLKTRAPV